MNKKKLYALHRGEHNLVIKVNKYKDVCMLGGENYLYNFAKYRVAKAELDELRQQLIWIGKHNG